MPRENPWSCRGREKKDLIPVFVQQALYGNGAHASGSKTHVLLASARPARARHPYSVRLREIAGQLLAFSYLSLRYHNEHVLDAAVRFAGMIYEISRVEFRVARFREVKVGTDAKRVIERNVLG